MRKWCSAAFLLAICSIGPTCFVAGAAQMASPPSPIPEPASPLCKPSASRPCKPPRIQVALNDVPRCTRKMGTVSVMDGDNPSGWTQFQLAAPQKLLRVLIQRSGCFSLVDRGSGLNAAQSERNVGGSIGPRRQSNVGQGQIKAADYVLVAEIAAANSNVSGSGTAAGIGGLLGNRVGGLHGGIKSKKMEANTVLSLTNVRTTETIAVEEGYAAKNNLSFGGGALPEATVAVGGGYDNTDIGQIVTLAFIQSYSKMVKDLGLAHPGAVDTAGAAPSKTFTAQAQLAMRATASATGRLLRSLPMGSIVYPTGEKNGLWWEVADENDNVGWVMNTKLAPSD